MKQPTIICLTPVKNEAWILDRFLECASLWADHIIIADQASDDGSTEIAKKFDKVTIIQNPSTEFNEPERQRLLIDAARRFAKPRLLITLDADEFLTPNFRENSEWESALRAPIGTVLRFRWANIRPDMRTYWSPPFEYPWGFMDDESVHYGIPIHSERVPVPANAPSLTIESIKVMHYQYVDWERMLSKHRWYQCWERIHNPTQSAVSVYRQYHHMDAITENDLRPIPHWWFEQYASHGIDIVNVPKVVPYRWDKEILEYIDRHGAGYFAREYIWDLDWKSRARQSGYTSHNVSKFNDPRGLLLKLFHRWLKSTQVRSHRQAVRAIDALLSRIY